MNYFTYIYGNFSTSVILLHQYDTYCWLVGLEFVLHLVPLVRFHVIIRMVSSFFLNQTCKAYSTRLKLYGLYLLAVKTLCRKFTKFSPRIGQPTETRFCFLSWIFYSVKLNFWFRHRMIPDYFSMQQDR